jgi:DegV family protein with EDD domain
MTGSPGPRVGVVTDSTVYLPVELARQLGGAVVPLQVTIADRSGDEGVDVSPDDVTRALLRGAVVQTSRPSPERFAAAYRAAFDAGATALVVVTISGALSGTFESAQAAAMGLPGEVRCIDSRSTAMGLGFAVMAAARAAADGADVDHVAATAAAVAGETRTLFCVDTLEYLRRGGRIGAVRALVGTALAVKPILHIEDGRIALLEKVRTATRARARLIDLAVEAASQRPVDVAVHHGADGGPSEAIARELRQRVPQLRSLVTAPLGAAVTAHVGPGVIGLVVAPA